MADAVRIDAPAKVNLRLRVLNRDTAGFHSLETVFCAISLVDVVEVRAADAGIRLDADESAEMGPPAANLAVRAAERFYRELDWPPAVRIRLRKRIPAAAGLGGGSSDAAAVLRALNTMHGEPFAGSVLLQLGSELGSDVPFFLCGSALALAWGRGERLLALPPLPVRPVLVAHPGVAMPTAAAFRRVAAARGAGHRHPAFGFGAGALTSWAGIAAIAANDFEPVADAEIPTLAPAREAMRDAGAEIAMLSGSGAALFGVFARDADRDRPMEILRGRSFAVWAAQTLPAPPRPQVDPTSGFP